MCIIINTTLTRLQAKVRQVMMSEYQVTKGGRLTIRSASALLVCETSRRLTWAETGSCSALNFERLYTATTLIAFMASKIFQWNRRVSLGSSTRTGESVTVCKGTQDKFTKLDSLINQGEVYERRIFYYSSKWHVYQNGLYTGSLTIFPANESHCLGNLHILKSLKFFRVILGVLGLPRYPMGAPGMSLIRYAPVFPRFAPQASWSSHDISSAHKASLRRREYVKILAKSAIRRKGKESQVRSDSISPAHPTRSPNSQKTRDLRKALVQTLGASVMKRELLVSATTKQTHTPKEVRLERRMRLALGENLSIKNLAFVAAARKASATAQPDRSPSRISSLQSKTRYQNQKSSRRSLFHQAAPTTFTLVVNPGPGDPVHAPL
ncbi:uncharacterized protein EDB91DRAFT_1152826 [Suillus paluster]|uniref:uncharacterized protein n=1 Tax=Suillus paluster TaxID=48578 RepID=UPI001B873530|nr:uncharacterized protein EDB91DRAFT_1152826 [Suillus paluster]KAG1732000.1 hypothetical protein EDB91DRAFT_1152826 [Suillus paluster]